MFMFLNSRRSCLFVPQEKIPDVFHYVETVLELKSGHSGHSDIRVDVMIFYHLSTTNSTNLNSIK